MERAKPASAVHAINAKGSRADPHLTRLLSSSQGRSNRGEGYENETPTLKQAGYGEEVLYSLISRSFHLQFLSVWFRPKMVSRFALEACSLDRYKIHGLITRAELNYGFEWDVLGTNEHF